MAINVLIIDDDKRSVQRLVNNLKRHDIHNMIGECIVDDSMIAEEDLEKYNPMKWGIKFDVLLVDYQLSTQYTGVLVAAWIMLQLRIPKLTLTTGTYSGPKDCFDGFLLKDELLDEPQNVIKKLVKVVDEFNAVLWLENQHRVLVDEYQILYQNKSVNGLNGADENRLSALEKLLDKFEKILDFEQEKEIKKRKIILDEQSEYINNITKQNQKISELSTRLDELLLEFKRYEE